METALRSLPAPVSGLLSRTSALLPRTKVATRRLAKFLALASMRPEERLVSYFDWADATTVRGLFRSEIVQSLRICNPLATMLETIPKSLSPLQKMLLLEQKFFLTDHNLNYTDKMSMAASVEVRVPFLDPDLMSLAACIPDKLRQRGRHGKWILKKAMGQFFRGK